MMLALQRWLSTVACGLLLVGSPTAQSVSGDGETPSPQRFVTLMFSRSAVSAADGSPCQRDDRNVATLEAVVAPYLRVRNLVATGTIQTGTTLQSQPSCIHYGETAATSWDAAGRLGRWFGWTFVSHSATYATQWLSMSPDEIWAETCGSAEAITSHGLSGASGLFAWPHDSYLDSIQAEYVSQCFAFGRQYSWIPTSLEHALAPPYYQHTKGMNGGSCNDPTLPCHGIVARGNAGHYNLPSAIIARLQSLEPGDWYTIQFYVLVTGKTPAYTTNRTEWDCTSADPSAHWTNDNERYCWNDFQAIVNAIPPGTVVTDPLTVARAIGRPGY